ncbi:MAG TPA: UbiA family prenyltransferase, partial [Polyangiaceae bacterium]
MTTGRELTSQARVPSSPSLASPAPALPASASSLPGSAALLASSTPSLPVDASGSLAAAHAASPKSTARGLLKTLRPHQWVKNLFVLAPMFFHKDVFVQTSVGTTLNLSITGRAFAATGVFCLLAGAVYTINDLVDVAADRVHPVKRFRPIASGIVPMGVARAVALALVAFSLGLAYLLAPALAVVAAVYFAENIAYTFKLKKV